MPPLHRRPGVAAAVFPHDPERAVYNNAVLERGLTARGRAESLDAMEAIYAGFRLDRWGEHLMNRVLRSS